MSDALTAEEIEAAGLPEPWRVEQDALHARFETGTFVAGLHLVNATGEVAEQANHHPDLTLTYPAVEVTLTSHDVGAITRRDLDLARQISQIATEQGIGS